MRSTTTLFSLLCVLVALVQALSPPRQHHDAKLERRARTVTITETETDTETLTETKTVTETPTCTLTDDGSSHETFTVWTNTLSSSTMRDTPLPTSTNDVSAIGNCYAVRGIGTFAVKKSYDFSSGKLSPDLQVSDYNVPDRQAGNPWNHGFKSSNVHISGGFLNLVVPGKQSPAKDSKKAIYGGEIYTTEPNILYGSIRTMAIFDDTPGTCQGIFSYHDDSNEIDIEFMGNSSSTANPSPAKAPVLWYTNQPGGTSDNQVTGPAPSDISSKVHEYRIDWTADWTRFYVNGVLQKTLRGDVPHSGSQWVWNNWSNGSPDWSTGPPIDDNTLKIQSITMYYNTTDGAACEQ